MKLVLINDLPLFSNPDDPDSFEKAIHSHIEAAQVQFPAATRYVGFEELVEIWDGATGGAAADVTLLVGTRPPLLADRAPGGSTVPRVRLTTSRDHDTAGRTATVKVLNPSDAAAIRDYSHVLVADDVAMSGATLRAVLTSGLVGPDATVSVRIAFATVCALQRLRGELPNADIHVAETLDFAPVTEGTAIFLSALFFGALRGRPFLCQRELLQPFFGVDLAPVHELRDLVRRLLPDFPVLQPKEADADDAAQPG